MRNCKQGSPQGKRPRERAWGAGRMGQAMETSQVPWGAGEGEAVESTF